MIRRLVVLTVLVLLGALSASAQTASPVPPARGGFTPAQRAEIVEILRNAMKTDPTILRDAIVTLQQAESDRESTAARDAIGSLGRVLTHTPGDPVAGNPDGEVTLVEFYDVRCPYCRRMLPAMVDLLRKEPKLRVVYKDIPILGPGSAVGARAALAAGKQGAYLKMREAMMTGPSDITAETVKSASARLGLDWERLQRDMADPALQARIDENLKLARQLGIQGTPAYVIGDQLLPGAVTVAELQTAIAQVRKR
jgi:protein-disulfide isomerase